MLTKEAVPDDKAIHDVRVLMKKSRAAIKLAAPQLTQEYISRDLAALREVGKKMCLWRESCVLRKELKKFVRDFPDVLAEIGDNDKIARILSEPVKPENYSEYLKAELEEINTLLHKAVFRIRFESMSRLDPNLLLRELEQTYINVIDIYVKCRNNPRYQNLHEFRKRAKDLLYQLYFFRSLNPSGIKVLERKLNSMTQYLGKYNDLAQLIVSLEYEYSSQNALPAMDELVLRIREKQDRYLSRIWPQAFKLFCPGQKLVNLLGYKLLII